MQQQERKDAVNVALGEGLWGFGMGLVAPLTVFPLLLKRLGAGPLELGLFTGVATAGFLLTQPIGTLLFSHGAGRKKFLITYHALVTLSCFAALSAVTLLLGPRGELHRAARWMLIAFYSVNVLGTGVIVSAWQDWVAGLFSAQSRGKAYGMWAGAWSLALAVSAVVAAKVRKGIEFPENYALLMLAAAVVFAVSLVQYSRVSSGHVPEGGYLRPGMRELLGLFARSLRERNFRRYLVGRVLLTLGGGAAGFIAVHFRSAEGGNLSDALIILLGAFLSLPQAAGSYLLGILGDRSGHKAGVLVGATAQLAAIVVAFLGTGWVACALSFAFLGVAAAEAMVSHQNMIFETCPHDRRIAHITVSSLILGPFVAAVFPATGLLIDLFGSTAAGIGLCIVPTALGALWLLFMVREPRQIMLGG